MDGLSFRFAEPKDAELLVKWSLDQPEIPMRDIQAAKDNPTTKCMIVEKDGIPVLMMPLYCLINLPFLAFNPDAKPRERLAALDVMLEYTKAFARQFGIAEVQVFSERGLSMANWAEKHGFVPEDRDAFVLKIPKEMVM